MERGHIIHPRGPSGHREGLSAKGEKNNGPLPAAMGGKNQQPNPPKPIGHWDPNKIHLVYTNLTLPTNVLAIFWLFSAKEICHESIVHQFGREEESVSWSASPLAHFLQSAATISFPRRCWLILSFTRMHRLAMGSEWPALPPARKGFPLQSQTLPSGIPAVVIFLLVSAHADTPLRTHSQAIEPWQTAETSPPDKHRTQQREAALCLVRATQMPPIFHFTGMSLALQEGAETSERCDRLPQDEPLPGSPAFLLSPPASVTLGSPGGEVMKPAGAGRIFSSRPAVGKEKAHSLPRLVCLCALRASLPRELAQSTAQLGVCHLRMGPRAQGKASASRVHARCFTLIKFSPHYRCKALTQANPGFCEFCTEWQSQYQAQSESNLPLITCICNSETADMPCCVPSCNLKYNPGLKVSICKRRGTAVPKLQANIWLHSARFKE